jgi:tetratricopeptide (TPR) repeat protein
VGQLYGISDPAEAYYNQLVEGFRSGQLCLKREVPEGLTKLADPYDQVANAPYREDGRLHDTTYYKGKLYLYFGVTPALVLFWPYVALTGHYLYHKQAVAIFCTVGFLAGVALLGALRRRYFPAIGPGVAAACALALGLATCVPVMLQRPDVWEVPISCAYAMVMLALAGVWRAWHAPPARRCWWLAAASLAYGLAVGARPSVLFGAVILLLPVANTWFSPPEHGGRRWLAAGRLLAAAVVPISLVGFGLMLYNYLRFNNPLEFGQHYQMSAQNEEDTQHVFGLKYLWFNFRVYFLQPIHWNRSFPFLDAIKVPPAPVGQLGVDYPFGALTNIPLVWMALAVPLAWRERAPAARSDLRWLISAVALIFGVSALTICLYAGACLRYQVDFVPALVMLAVCGVLGLERALAAKPRWRSVARCGWLGVLSFSVAVNLLMSVNLYAEERCRDGVDQLHLGRTKEAIAYFEETLRIKPDHTKAHNGLGTALAQTGQLAAAIAQFQEAVRLDPDNLEARANLASALAQSGDTAGAIEQNAELLRAQPDSAEAHYNLGSALAQTGRVPEAMQQFQEAVRLRPDYAEAHNNLGTAFFVEGRLAEAASQYEAALRVKPDFAEARFNLGSLFVKMGRTAEAIEQIQNAVRLRPDYPEARYNLGLVLAQTGRTEDAIAQYEEALKLKPDYAEARAGLEQLRTRPPDGGQPAK